MKAPLGERVLLLPAESLKGEKSRKGKERKAGKRLNEMQGGKIKIREVDLGGEGDKMSLMSR